LLTAAVATAVLGHKALTATPAYLNSSAIPKTHIDIPYLAIV